MERVRANTPTVCPAAAKRVATARPIPGPAPITNTAPLGIVTPVSSHGSRDHGTCRSRGRRAAADQREGLTNV
ncbi:hypothetical protein GCM10009619_08310 [Williamsia maris]